MLVTFWPLYESTLAVVKGLPLLMYWLIRALNMRASSASYRVLSRFLKTADAAHPDGLDPTLDLDFRSGVDFGMASMSLILSLLPSSAIRIMEIFGFSGNRSEALDGLMKTGGWTKTGRNPNVSEGPGKEGIRSPVRAVQGHQYTAA